MRASRESLGVTFDAVRPRLELVERFIDDQLDGGPAPVREVGRYVLEGGGKRLRPALMLVVAKLLGYEGDRDIRYAAVIEMIHTATLVHDDIIDHSRTRRGRATANDRWGNQLTVLFGDWLYIRSMELALEVGDLEILRTLSRATVQMVEGEILGLTHQGRIDVSLEKYLDLVRRKTAELFSASCSLPALFEPELASNFPDLAEYGRNLGICFQIVDDLLDLTSSEHRLGKPVFSDLREGKLTLPLILLLPRLDKAQRRAIEGVLKDGEFHDIEPAELRSWLTQHGAIDDAMKVASDYGQRAVAAATRLPEGPEREALTIAPDFILHRDF